MKKLKQVGDLYKWAGYRNDNTRQIEGGYLYFITKIKGNTTEMTGKSIRNVSNRSQAIKKARELGIMDDNNRLLKEA